MSALSGIPPKIGKLIPRLATDHDGEVVATVRAIERTLKGAGLDFHDLANAIDAPPPAAISKARTRRPRDTEAEQQGSPFTDESTTWRELVAWCREVGRSRLRPDDTNFLCVLALNLATGREPSPKQQKWIRDIYSKLQRAGR